MGRRRDNNIPSQGVEVETLNPQAKTRTKTQTFLTQDTTPLNPGREEMRTRKGEKEVYRVTGTLYLYDPRKAEYLYKARNKIIVESYKAPNALDQSIYKATELLKVHKSDAETEGYKCTDIKVEEVAEIIDVYIECQKGEDRKRVGVMLQLS